VAIVISSTGSPSTQPTHTTHTIRERIEISSVVLQYLCTKSCIFTKPPATRLTDAAQKVALTKELERAKDKLESRLAALEADIHRATLAAKVLAQRKGNLRLGSCHFSIDRLVNPVGHHESHLFKMAPVRVSFLGIRL